MRATITRLASTLRILSLAESAVLPLRRCRLWAIGSILACALAGAASAQSTAGWTPLTVTPGAPAGSYPVSGFESINYFSGSLNFSLPLLNVRGRGDAHTTVALTIDQHWSMVNATSQGGVPVFNPWTPLTVGYGPGIFTGRAVVQGTPCGIGFIVNRSLTRFTFTDPNGTETEFRDTLWDGQPGSTACVLVTAGFYRGTEFVSNDGSAASFTSAEAIRDSVGGGNGAITLTPTGTLRWRDGTQYSIANGLVTEIRDRNGNLLQFAYTAGRVTQIKDSLLRTVNVAYEQGANSNEDWITFKGFGGAARKITVKRVPLGQAFAPGSGYLVRTLSQLFPEFTPTLTTLHQPTVVRSVELPNGRSYTFDYNQYGELEQVTLPTTGRFRYTYAAGFRDGAASGAYFFDPAAIYRRVVQRDVYRDATAGSLDIQTLISRQESLVTGAEPYVLVEFKAASGTPMRTVRHYYHGRPSDSTQVDRDAYSYAGFREGREQRTEIVDGTTVLRTVENEWSQGDDVIWWLPTFPPELEPAKNPRILSSRIVLDSGEESTQFHEYDAYNNRTSTIETGFGVGGYGLLIRKTVTDYVTAYDPAGSTASANYATDPAIHIRDLPKEQRIYTWNGSTWGVPVAHTTYEYDNYTSDGVHAQLFDYGSTLTGLHPVFDGPYAYRGNVTTTSRMLNDPVGTVSSHSRYDITGNVVAAVDPRNVVTTFQYGEHFGSPNGSIADDTTPSELDDENGTRKTHAFATTVANGLGHTTQRQIDYYLGQVVDEQDPNGVISSAYFNDALDRPTDIIRANDVSGSLPERNRLRFIYNDAVRFVRTRQDRNSFGDDLQRSETHYDTLGRAVETRSYEIDANPDSQSEYIVVRKSYDGLGRVRQVSNPFSIKPTNPETAVWTTTTYDKLDRVFDIETPDGQVARTRYVGSQTTVTDQAGKVRRSFVDALGRLKTVIEAPGTLDYETQYEYNAFDQLEKVTPEGGQAARRFTHDSLGRLRSQSNPEGGDVDFTYDASGNLTEREDARVRVNYGVYDAINRPTSMSYTPALSPPVTYTYDDAAAGFAKGRLTRVSNSVSTTDYLGYDRLGRASQSRQTTAGATYPFVYSYDLAGNLKSRTYPSGRVIGTTYDRPGRVISVQQTGPGAQTFADSAMYASSGILTRLKLGNQRWENTPLINNRLQPERIGLGNTDESLDIFRLDFTYNDASPNNNGNLRSQIIRVGGFALAQTYTYDDLNRLKTAGESAAWSQAYDYDTYGNRAVTATSGYVNSPLTPMALSAFDLKNQIIASDYDGTGNQTGDVLGRTFTYNGENRQASFRVPQWPTVPDVLYAYDGEGRRVTKQQGAATRLLVYDAFGMLAAEYLTSASTSAGTQYSTPDHLGSVRVVTDASGNVVSRHDYLPFGEEITSTLGSRPQIFGYDKGDAFRQRFTGKERDAESRLDFFEARYHSGAQGRFTSADPIADLVAYARDPQQWNRYGYVRNNPLVLVDPDGRATRTNEEGYVLEVTDDGDLGVYRGDVRVGETEYWDEFRAHDSDSGAIQPDVPEGARIDFGSSWEPVIRVSNEYAVALDNLPTVAEKSRNGQFFDIKTDERVAPYGPATGRLLEGKYATARSAGNYLAGLNMATVNGGIDHDTGMRLAGMLDRGQYSAGNVARVLLLGKSFGASPWFGEIEYSGRRIQQGYRAGYRAKAR